MKDGGPAFPSDPAMYGAKAVPGMSLRDWFAGMALQGLWASPFNRGRGYEEDSISAYEMADAMLAERERLK